MNQTPQQWAAQKLNQLDWIILDTETTGLHNHAEIVQIAIIDSAGNTLLDSLIKPQDSIPAESTAIHGITAAMVANAPTFTELYRTIAELLTGKKVLIYNRAFDYMRLYADCVRHSLPEIEFDAECVMERYAEHYGSWNSYYQSYRWQSLDTALRAESIDARTLPAAHSALGDCHRTLAVLKAMAVPVTLAPDPAPHVVYN